MTQLSVETIRELQSVADLYLRHETERLRRVANEQPGGASNPAPKRRRAAARVDD